MLGKKLSEKSAKNFFLYSHEYRDKKMGAEKKRETIFPETHEKFEQKMLGKKSSERSEKNVLFIFTRISLPKRGKNTRNNFSRNTRIVRAKNVGKKSSEKSAKNVFLYSHEYRDQKIGGTKRAKQFFQKYTISARKKCLEKNSRKKVRKRFFIFTRIS